MRWCNADEITPINTHERAESDPLALVFCIYVDTRRGGALFLRGHLWWISCACLILSGRLWSWVWHNISPAAATNSQTKGSHRRSYRPQRRYGSIFGSIHIHVSFTFSVSTDKRSEGASFFLRVLIKQRCFCKRARSLRRLRLKFGKRHRGCCGGCWSGRKKRNCRSRGGECNRLDVKKRGIVAARHQGAASSSDRESSAQTHCFG